MHKKREEMDANPREKKHKKRKEIDLNPREISA